MYLSETCAHDAKPVAIDPRMAGWFWPINISAKATQPIWCVQGFLMNKDAADRVTNVKGLPDYNLISS